MKYGTTIENLVCMWMKIQELHGIKSLRDIQKTKPKLIAIEPKLIANPLLKMDDLGVPLFYETSKSASLRPTKSTKTVIPRVNSRTQIAADIRSIKIRSGIDFVFLSIKKQNECLPDLPCHLSIQNGRPVEVLRHHPRLVTEEQRCSLGCKLIKYNAGPPR